MAGGGIKETPTYVSAWALLRSGSAWRGWIRSDAMRTTRSEIAFGRTARLMLLKS